MTTYEHEDRFFHYDQVGSVMTVTDAEGELAARRHADAFGNTLQSWDGGLWATPQAAAGWGHNTKETDGGTGLVYMYQRWYLPHTGTFASQAPYPPMMEHEYGFAEGNPVMMVDPRGRYPLDFQIWAGPGGDVSLEPGSIEYHFIEILKEQFAQWPRISLGGSAAFKDLGCSWRPGTGELVCCFGHSGTLIGGGVGASAGEAWSDVSFTFGKGRYLGMTGGDGTVGITLGPSIGIPVVCPSVDTFCITFTRGGIKDPHGAILNLHRLLRTQ